LYKGNAVGYKFNINATVIVRNTIQRQSQLNDLTAGIASVILFLSSFCCFYDNRFMLATEHIRHEI
jgi:hypothetical protein